VTVRSGTGPAAAEQTRSGQVTPSTDRARVYGACGNTEQRCTYVGTLRADGTVRAHKETSWGRPCAGAGQPPRAGSVH
jgi:hypothetical protein